MRNFLAVLLIAASAAAGGADAPAPASPNTIVSFSHPEKFVDASDRDFGAPPSPRVLDALKAELEALGRKYLPSGETLDVQITDVDLAGRFDPVPRRGGESVRVLREVDWPRITLNYRLLRDGQLVKQDQVRVADMNYLNRPTLRYSGDNLRYEKRMLDEWFANTFGRRPDAQ